MDSTEMMVISSAKVPATKRNWILRSCVVGDSNVNNQTAVISVPPVATAKVAPLKTPFTASPKGIGQKISLINHLNQKISESQMATDSWKHRYKVAKNVFETPKPPDSHTAEGERVVDESFRFIDAEVNAIKRSKGKSSRVEQLQQSDARRYSSQPHVSFSDEVTFVHNGNAAEIRYFSSTDQLALNSLYANVSKVRPLERPTAVQPLQIATDFPTSFLYRNSPRDPSLYQPSLSVDRPLIRRPTVKVMPLKTAHNGPLMKSQSLQDFSGRQLDSAKVDARPTPLPDRPDIIRPYIDILSSGRLHDLTPSETISGMPEPMPNLGNWIPQERNDTRWHPKKRKVSEIIKSRGFCLCVSIITVVLLTVGVCIAVIIILD